MKIENELKSKFSSEQQKALINIIFTSNWVSNKIYAELKKYNLTNEQYNVLRILRGSSPDSICLKEISCRMINRHSNTTRIVEKLLNKGYLVKESSDEDRRELSIRITESGMKLLSEIDSNSKIGDGIVKLSDEDSRQLNNLLNSVRD
jgi:DNA-binding MarR family transcriptional regulator